jgi:hypothetical protein
MLCTNSGFLSTKNSAGYVRKIHENLKQDQAQTVCVSSVLVIKLPMEVGLSVLVADI